MATYGQNYLYGTANTEQFKTEMENYSGMDLDWFFNEWAYKANYPKHNWSWVWTSAGSNYYLNISINQKQTDTTFAFRMPVQFKLSALAAADSVITLQDSLRNQQFTLTLNNIPTNLVFDPNYWILSADTLKTYPHLAGAIQDWDRGVIIGDTTFGKGMVQSLLELEDGLALKLTTAKYFTPSGRCLQRSEGQRGEEIASLTWHPPAKTDSISEVQYFTTQAGRKVPGSGGIVPDIMEPGWEVSPLQYQLSREGIFFDFAVDYLSQHPQVEQNFEVTEEVYRHFLDFVKSKNFQYQSASKIELENLGYVAEEEFGSEVLKQKISILDWFVKQEERNIFQQRKEELKWKIKEAILVNHFGEKARYEKVWFLSHPEILKAQEILKDKKSYSALLTG
jgi:carboxyl-terminal processing protease